MAEITAARINNLQSRIELIVGNGAGENGYGQSVLSSQVSNLSGVIEAADINNIYNDMIKARVHQVGPGDAGIRQVLQNLNVVAEDTSFFVNDSGVVSTDADGALKGIRDFENLMSDIEVDKFQVHPSQAVVETAITDTLSSRWNGLRDQEVRVTFTDADHRRHFFNTGGEIRFAANVTGAATLKGLDWAQLCSTIGTVSFKYNTTTVSGSGTPQSIGNYQLTTSYQTIYQKVGAGYYTGVYSGNLYTIKAKYTDANVIWFKIEFNDVVFDNNIDNDVDGRLESVVQQFRANNTVSVPSPSYTNISTLA